MHESPGFPRGLLSLARDLSPVASRRAVAACIAVILGAGTAAALPPKSDVPAKPDEVKSEKAPAEAPANRAAPAAREAAIRAALEKRLDLDYNWKPLEDLLTDLCTRLDVPLWIDRATLSEDGVALDTPVTLRLRQVAGRSALNLILSPSQLAWLVDDEVLKITTATHASDLLETRAYDVTDLVTGRSPKGPHGFDFSAVVNPIQQCIEPDSWEDVSGPGSMHGYVAGEARILGIRQTQAIHEKIESLLADLRAVIKRESAPEDRNAPLPSRRTPIAVREEAIRRALDKPVTLDSNEQPLEDVLEGLARQLNINMVIDRATLAEDGVALDTPIALKVTDISARSALKLLLEPSQLTWLVRDEVLLITTSTRASDKMEARVFDVSDLVVYRDESGRILGDFNSLSNLLSNVIEPDAWGEGGATIAPFRHGRTGAIIVPQTPAILDEIALFLAEMRAVKRQIESGAGPRREKPARIEPTSSFRTSLRLSDPRQEALARGVTQFTIDLYGKVAPKAAGNLILSPYCVWQAMGMAYAGARGETVREISETMHFILRQEDTLASLGPFGLSAGGIGGTGNRVGRVGQIWAPKETEFLAPFQETIRTKFHGDLANLDFSNREKAAQEINDWAVSHGDGSIVRAVAPEDLPGGNAFVLAAMMRFVGGWTNPFPRDETKLAKFWTPEGDVDVALMHLPADSCGYALVDDLEVLDKTYSDRGFSLVVLLPAKKAGALARVESALSENNLAKWLASAEEQQVDVFLPRFRLESSLNLRAPLEALGMRRTFDPEEADFSGMAQRPTPAQRVRLALGTVLHRAFAEVDERGSSPIFDDQPGSRAIRAKAADELPTFRADRPFLFLVRNNFNGSLLFIGRVTRPEPTTGSSLRPGQPER